MPDRPIGEASHVGQQKQLIPGFRYEIVDPLRLSNNMFVHPELRGTRIRCTHHRQKVPYCRVNPKLSSCVKLRRQGDVFVHAELQGAPVTIVKNADPSRPVPPLTISQVSRKTAYLHGGRSDPGGRPVTLPLTLLTDGNSAQGVLHLSQCEV